MPGQYYPVGIYTRPFVYYQSLKEDPYTKTEEAEKLKHNTLDGATMFLSGETFHEPKKINRPVQEQVAAAALEFLRQAAEIERNREKTVIRANIDKIAEGEIKDKLLAALDGTVENYYDFILALNASIKGVEEARAQIQRELERLTEYKRRYGNFRKKIEQMGKSAKDLTPDDIALLRESKDTDIWDERIIWTTQQQRVGTSLITTQNGRRVANVDAISRSLVSRRSQIYELSRGLLEDHLPQIFSYSNGGFKENPRRVLVVSRLITQKYNELLVDELDKETSNAATLRYRKGEYAATKDKLGPIIDDYIKGLLERPDVGVILDNYADLYNFDDSKIRDIDGLQYRYKQINQTLKNAYQTYKKQGGELTEKEWRAKNKIDKNYILKMVSALDAVSVQIHYTSEVNSAEEQRQAYRNGITQVVGKNEGATDVITHGQFEIEIKVNEEGIEAAIEKIERQMDAVNQETSAALQKARKASSFKDVMYNAKLFRDLHEKQEKAIKTILATLTENEKRLVDFKKIFNIHNSVKDYATIDVKTDKFSGATLGSDLGEQLKSIGKAANLANQKFDKKWLQIALINTASGLIGEKNKPLLENYLAIFASFFMFSDALENIATIAKQIVTKTAPMASDVHVYNLDGNYFPQSYVLQRLYDSLSAKKNEYMMESFASTNTAIQVHIHNTYQIKDNFITEDDYKKEGNWTMKEWYKEAAAALKATTLSMTIIKDFIQELQNLFDNFSL